ncbi:MAG TPA: ligase-associated DNA damage response DEXH box helicase [Phycisphaerales bacterium]|nr:ligase-associated DNA damage response DEXH box helicase [Phycisphaerales bacterium]HMP38622.1 ligase-associated DNA damage response DEXH box helicase [Phycisphaerales bacterium]
MTASPLGAPQRSELAALLHPRVAGWFSGRGWRPSPFQLDAWRAFRSGASGLIHVPTGTGKTYAAFLAPLSALLAEPQAPGGRGLRVLYVTPLRAVARDIELALRAPVDESGGSAAEPVIEVGSRTGDTSTTIRARQRERLPEVLVTTPESLTLLLTREDAPALLAELRCTIVDEWHELLGSKRGVQVELALARLRLLARGMQTWGLSATLADPDRAARALVGSTAPAPAVITAAVERPIAVTTLIPATVERFPWAGHMGLAMLEPLVRALDPRRSTLIFTNTRSQAERWFQAILLARPEWAERMGLHHGSIDRAIRERVEAGLKDGSTTLVVCTSSLDLGVDFGPVERVVQIGSPKGVARLIQRAGRSGHRPGARCEVLCVPTHALELVEIAAAREAIAAGRIERRPPPRRPLDALVQHMVSMSFGSGFDPEALFAEVRDAVAYEDLSRAEFDWCLALVERGGAALGAYPEQHRVQRRDGRLRIGSPRIAAIHRLNVGTIVGDATVQLRLRGGATIGSIEEGFIARLRPRDVFLFGGRLLEFVRLHDMTAYVVPATRQTIHTPHWSGSRFPLSTALSAAVRDLLGRLAAEDPAALDAPEIASAAPVLEAQRRLSRLPRRDETLVEIAASGDGAHCFIYPFEGRLVHEGLAALVALRLGRRCRGTFALSMNDYGVELVGPEGYPFAELVDAALFGSEGMTEDLLEAINLGELARRQFREVARVAGLLPQKYPGGERTMRQLQAGSTLLFEVFEEFDPSNLLLLQARREVLERHCEESRLGRTLQRLSMQPLLVVPVERPTPLGFPLVVDRLGSTLSTESLRDRVAAMQRWDP